MEHDCIRFRFASGAISEWEFERDGETLIVDPPARRIIGGSGALATICHAIAGRGILMGFRNWLEPHFQAGELVPVLPEWWVEFEGPRLCFSSRLMPAPLRAFVDYVTEQRRAPPPQAANA